MEKRYLTAEDFIRIADQDLEKAKAFSIASKYLTPWISGRNFLSNYVKFGVYKRRLQTINEELS